MRRILRPVLVVLAIIFLIEAWLWDRLQPVVAAIVARIPLESVKRWLAETIHTLPPPLALLVFLVPVLILFPLKLLAVWLLAHGAFVSAAGVFIVGKLAGVGVTAFVFDAARDRLLQMGWFHALYDTVMAWRDYAHALIDPIRRRIEAQMRLLLPAQSRRAIGLWKRVRRLRRRMHADEAMRG